MIANAIILCGGLATRLGSLTANTPKSLLPVNGEPFLAHQLRLLRRNHITRVVLCTGYLGDRIQEFAGNGSAFELDICYSEDGPVALGTGGAIRKALPLTGESFFVLYGDSYLPCDYQRVAAAFEQSVQTALMTIYRNEDAHDTSNVEYADGKILRYDKKNRTPAMKFIDYGLGIFKRSAFGNRPPTAFDLADIYVDLLDQGQLATLVMEQRFYEIGSVSGLTETEQFLRGQ